MPKIKIYICIYKLATDSSNYDEFKLSYESIISDTDIVNPFLQTILIA